jgi:hypothetical protein
VQIQNAALLQYGYFIPRLLGETDFGFVWYPLRNSDFSLKFWRAVQRMRLILSEVFGRNGTTIYHLLMFLHEGMCVQHPDLL